MAERIRKSIPNLACESGHVGKVSEWSDNGRTWFSCSAKLQNGDWCNADAAPFDSPQGTAAPPPAPAPSSSLDQGAGAWGGEDERFAFGLAWEQVMSAKPADLKVDTWLDQSDEGLVKLAMRVRSLMKAARDD